jgi:restriction endonuclease S subunit
MIATIKLKEVTASDLFRRLNSYSKQHGLYRALKAFGQVPKSLFILRVTDDPVLRQMNETLEAMAQALFKSWFVDFDPVKVLSGQMPEKPPFLSAHAFDLRKAGFPDRFQSSELGEIPDGWQIKTIGDIAERVAMGPFGSSIKVETFVSDGMDRRDCASHASICAF